MITLTITLKSTDHQIVFAYDTQESLTSKGSIDCGMVVRTDDYGQEAKYMSDDVISTVLSDTEKHWEYRNAVSIIKLKAENDFNALLQADPSLRFLTGGIRPDFGSK